jgi:hypothetical protein
MDGPDHYMEAKRLEEVATSDQWEEGDRDKALRLAHLHATLALTAAVATLITQAKDMPVDDQLKWARSISR